MTSSEQTPVFRFVCGPGLGLNSKPSQYGSQTDPMRNGCRMPTAVPQFRALALSADMLEMRNNGSQLLPGSTCAESRTPSDNLNSVQEQSSQSCRCQRPQSIIMCSSCGCTFVGRVRTQCNVHPSQIFLMDHEFCPRCCSSSLKEYRKNEL